MANNVSFRDKTGSYITRSSHHHEDLPKESTWIEPNQRYLDRAMNPLKTKDELLPSIVGWLSIALAFLVCTLDAAYGVNAARSSISHYYYAPIAGSAFVVILAFISAFMIAYRGQSPLDGWITSIGGVCALITALFPTAGLGIKGGKPIDHRFVENVALNGNEQDGYTAEEIIKSGNQFQDLMQKFFGFFSDEISVLSTKAFETVDGKEVDAIIATTYVVGNAWSQRFHQTGAIILIASLVVLSIVHMLRKNWAVYNIDADSYIVRSGRRWDWEYVLTLICIVVMLIGCWMASGLFWVDQAEKLSVTFSDFQVASTLLGNDFSGIPRPVFHGELLALVAFGISWLVQAYYYGKFKSKEAFERIDELRSDN